MQGSGFVLTGTMPDNQVVINPTSPHVPEQIADERSEKQSGERSDELAGEPFGDPFGDQQAELAKSRTEVGGQLVVFSDDWGRHPSSCQHLIGKILDGTTSFDGRAVQVIWVNTIGTRSPRLGVEDVGKAVRKITTWLYDRRPGGGQATDDIDVTQPSVISPAMYPGFRRAWQRRFNANAIAKSVNAALGERREGVKRIAVTTVPIVADAMAMLDVDRRVYYCVDDFSVWPGLDGGVMDAMERELVGQMDAMIAVSPTLVDRLGQMPGVDGDEVKLLTHGIDRAHWAAGGGGRGKDVEGLPKWWTRLAMRSPILLFWGVVDRRLDTSWCDALASRCGTLVLAGPQQSPDARLSRHDRIVLPGAAAYASLPAMAAASDVLVMPYADIPVTRAIQPLKFKEYMATGKPVVVRSLPATVDWSDAADVVSQLDMCVTIARQRAKQGVPAEQLQARKRLVDEGWDQKSTQFASWVWG